MDNDNPAPTATHIISSPFIASSKEKHVGIIFMWGAVLCVLKATPEVCFIEQSQLLSQQSNPEVKIKEQTRLPVVTNRRYRPFFNLQDSYSFNIRIL